MLSGVNGFMESWVLFVKIQIMMVLENEHTKTIPEYV